MINKRWVLLIQLIRFDYTEFHEAAAIFTHSTSVASIPRGCSCVDCTKLKMKAH